MESLWRDLVLAARRLRATPIFTIFAVASLALGVGVTTAVYAAVSSLLWKPPAVEDPGRVVMLTRQGRSEVVSREDLDELLTADACCDRLAASARIGVTLVDRAFTTALRGEVVTGPYFDALGVRASLGRTLQPIDDDPARGLAVVVGGRIWRTQFAADPAVVGRVVRINGRPVEIVGVVAEPFAGLGQAVMANTDVWLSLPAASADRLSRFTVLGRLRDDRAVSDAASEFAAAGRRRDVVAPLDDGGSGLAARQWSAVSYEAALAEPPGRLPIGAIIMVLVGLVLAVAAANLANLVLGRGAARRREVAVRRALGASRWRLVREQLAESALIAAGGAMGAYLVIRVLLVVFAVELQVSRFRIVQLDPELNVRTLGVAAAALLAALVVMGLFPAWQLTRQEVRAFITSDTGGISQGWWRRRKQSVTWQVAASLGLLLVAMTCLRVVIDVARHDSGVDVDRIAVGYLSQPSDWTPDRTLRATEGLLAAVRQQPEVDDVAVSSGLPFGTLTPAVSVTTMDRPFGIGGRDRQATLIAATPSIFRVTGVSVLRGRPLEAADMASASEVAVISEQTARDLFGTIDVVGREMRVRDWPTSSDRSAQLGRTATIVGIAADTDTSRLFSRRQGAIYMPLAPFLRSGRPALLTVTARTPGDPDAVMARLRTATRFADPDLAIGPGSSSGRVVLAGAYVNLGFLGILLGSLGALAVVLSTAGLYGVLSHVTARRTREIGLRMALGAGRVRVMRLVLTDGLRPVVEGILIGLVVATAARVILHYVTEGAVAPVGVVTSVLACLPLVLAALLACYLPARRAAGIEPNQALREL